MNKRSENCWKKFCETGQVSDYLEYRSAVAFNQKSPDAEQREGEPHAAGDTRSGGQREIIG